MITNPHEVLIHLTWQCVDYSYSRLVRYRGLEPGGHCLVIYRRREGEGKELSRCLEEFIDCRRCNKRCLLASLHVHTRTRVCTYMPTSSRRCIRLSQIAASRARAMTNASRGKRTSVRLRDWISLRIFSIGTTTFHRIFSLRRSLHKIVYSFFPGKRDPYHYTYPYPYMRRSFRYFYLFCMRYEENHIFLVYHLA